MIMILEIKINNITNIKPFDMDKTVKDNLKEETIKTMKVDNNGKVENNTQLKANDLNIGKEPTAENGLKEFKLLTTKLPKRSTAVSNQTISDQSIDQVRMIKLSLHF
jgi:hypothetical protein